MLDICDRWQLLRLTSRRPELMDRMMERMRVSFSAVSRIDGGMALDEARTKCIFCRHGVECRYWLEVSDKLRAPIDFCPNTAFFRCCTDDKQ
jgi:Family of unknown function (DUF6455)